MVPMRMNLDVSWVKEHFALGAPEEARKTQETVILHGSAEQPAGPDSPFVGVPKAELRIVITNPDLFGSFKQHTKLNAYFMPVEG